jgi:hypothetical protein
LIALIGAGRTRRLRRFSIGINTLPMAGLEKANVRLLFGVMLFMRLYELLGSEL